MAEVFHLLIQESPMMLITSLRSSFHTAQINRLPAYMRTAEIKHTLPLAISLFMNIGLPCQRQDQKRASV
jgi:hypothetical protein